MKKRLTIHHQRKIKEYWDGVSHVEKHYREFSRYPDRALNSYSDFRPSKNGEGNLGNQFPKPGLEFAYEQIADLFSKNGVLIDFIEWIRPFTANNYHHAIMILLHPKEFDQSAECIFSKGYQILIERARAECNERSSEKQYSRLNCSQTTEAFLVKNLIDQMNKQIDDGRTPEPLQLNTLVNDFMGGHWNQSQVSRAMKKTQFKDYKGYVAWFRRMTGQNPPSLPKDRKGRVIRGERVDESFQSLDEFEEPGDGEIDQQWG